MRIIGHLNSESGARAFGDYLYVQGIENEVEAEANQSWAIWVHDDEQLTNAADLLTRFQQNPADSRYEAASVEAGRKRADAKKDLQDYQKRFHRGSQVFQRFSIYGMGRLTLILVLICCGVFLVSEFGNNPARIRELFLSEYRVPGGPLERLKGMSEVLHGQVWRLFTPVFIHFSFMHILFNMMWLMDLGSMIEGRKSARLLGVLVLGIAISSNLAQYAMSGPLFGGMSGVVYGLAGYIWIRGRLDPGCGLFLHPTTVTMMLIWFFVCLAGWIPQVANTVHAVGLGVGMFWGFAATLRLGR